MNTDSGTGTFVAYAAAPTRLVEVPSSEQVGTRAHASVEVRDFFGSSSPANEEGPQAFLAGVPAPGGRVGAHFHDVDQFQLFFPASGGWYQRTSLESATIHYADRYTTYGPFGSDGEYLAFMTLRAEPSRLTAHMPGSAHLRRDRPGRNMHCVVPDSSVGTPAESYRETALLVEQADGMGVSLVELGPNATWTARRTFDAARYLVVLAGDVLVGDKAYGPRSVGWSATGSRVPNLTSAHAPAAVLIMTFPARGEVAT